MIISFDIIIKYGTPKGSAVFFLDMLLIVIA